MATSIFAASQSSARQHAAIAGINITPLVDVMLVLLVIFMVTMPLRTDTLRLTLPGDVRQHAPPPAEPVQLQVQADGSTLLDDVRAEQADLLQELRPSTHWHRRRCWRWMVRMTSITARSPPRLRRHAMPASRRSRSVASGCYAAAAASTMRR